MKDQIAELLRQAVAALIEAGTLPAVDANVRVDNTRDKSHGDFATNLALTLAKPTKLPPREIAQHLIDALADVEQISRCEIAGPGFINFFVTQDVRQQVVSNILELGDAFGESDFGEGKKVQVEFVSANPTGPLHVGHGRGAAYGATLAALLKAVGFDVQTEYYVNDAGRQMDILAASVWLRYLELGGMAFAPHFSFPSNGYKGDYVQDIAATLRREHDAAFDFSVQEIYASVSADEPEGGDKETHIDDLIAVARKLLGDGYETVFNAGLEMLLADIRDDLGLFGVHYDAWFSERSLVATGAVTEAVQRLTASGHIYEQGGAQWFRSTAFGDEKDRVVIRDNGQGTYFASDIAYHMNKLDRGFTQIIDVWGADHHGYVPRVQAAMGALGGDKQALDVLLVQFAVLYRNGKKVSMSTRSGDFVTLRQLRKDVGKDAARFFYVMRRCEQHLDFDLDLAKSQSNENPVYYIQYAHARVSSVFRQLADKEMIHDAVNGASHLEQLTEPHEQALFTRLARYPELLKSCALNKEPHQLAQYLRDLANEFHTYYNAHQFLVDDSGLRNARLNLILAAQQVLRNGLRLLGVSAPEQM